MNQRPLVMIVDDQITYIELLNAALEDEYEICFATDGEEAIKLALDVLPDLILLDVVMPGIDGYEVCRRLKQESMLADTPIIFTTGLDDQEAELRGLALGAIDYVTKPISPIIVRARVRNHLELKRMHDELAELAVTDALTGLGNRRRLEQTLKQDTARLARSGDCLSVIMLDIDFFKQFNDTYGHPAGDHCIMMVAACLNRAVRRAADLKARYGGEEFACVMPGMTHDEAMVVADNIRKQVLSLGIPHSRSTASPFVTVSVGVGTANCLPGMDPDLWIKVADQQLYLAKKSGRNSIVGRIFNADDALFSNSIEHVKTAPTTERISSGAFQPIEQIQRDPMQSLH